MYLMYYLNEDGKRVYTLKVRHSFDRSLSIEALSLSLVYSFTRSCFRCFINKISRIELRSSDAIFFSLLSPPPPLLTQIEFRKPLRMGSRRFPRTRRDSPRTISFRSRESRVRKGLVYSPRSSRRNSFKPNAGGIFEKKPKYQ